MYKDKYFSKNMGKFQWSQGHYPGVGPEAV